MKLDFEAQFRFIDTEFRARFRAVVDLISQPIARRVDQFGCWPGLTVESMAPDGERVVLSFRSNPSKLRTGDYVYVNSMDVEPKDVLSGPEGIIESIDEGRGVCRLRAGHQVASRFARTLRIGMRLVLDETVPGDRLSREMPTLALRTLRGEFGETPRTRRLLELLEGSGRPRPTAEAPIDGDDPRLGALTPAQFEAVRAGVETDFALVQGPPGTGKTHTLGLLVRELVRRGLKVGVCAFTHQGINNLLAECLGHAEIRDIVKIGSEENLSSDLRGSRIRLVKRPGEYFRSKSVPDVTGLTQHAAFNPIARLIDGGAAGALPSRFDVLVFDEAGQLTIPAAVMAMLQCDRLVLAGDHCQLPPVVQTMRPGFGPAVSIFQHLIEGAGHHPVLLDRSFRLNRGLVDFPSREFYGGRLVSAPTAADRRLEFAARGDCAAILDADAASTLAVVRHEGRGQESAEEAALAARIVAEAMQAGVPAREIAVIAAHRRQNVKIREMAAALGAPVGEVVIDTVERIQGQERDLVILSMTLSDPDALAAEAGFLFLPNRFNVAITRARRKLVVIASPGFFRALPRREELDHPGSGALDAVNVLKRWYLRHRSTAVDATALAARTLDEIVRRKTETANEQGPVEGAPRAPSGSTEA